MLVFFGNLTLACLLAEHEFFQRHGALAFVLAIADLNSARHSDWFSFGILGVFSSSIFRSFFQHTAWCACGMSFVFLSIGLDDERFSFCYFFMIPCISTKGHRWIYMCPLQLDFGLQIAQELFYFSITTLSHFTARALALRTSLSPLLLCPRHRISDLEHRADK